MLLILQVITLSACTVSPRLASNEERLLELLFDGYNPSARPVINSSHTVNVSMQFSLLHIQELVSSIPMLFTTIIALLSSPARPMY